MCHNGISAAIPSAFDITWQHPGKTLSSIQVFDGLEHLVVCYLQKQRAEKRIVKREKREAAQREAQKAAEAFLQISPRKAPGRRTHNAADPSSTPASTQDFLAQEVCPSS